jgi:hypothetical protein
MASFVADNNCRISSSSLMASGRRTQTIKEDIVFPTGIFKKKKAKKIYLQASKNIIEAYNYFLSQGIKKDEVSKFQNTLQSMAPAREAQAIFNLPPTPAIVKNLDAVQRSYLKTDLPYQVISPNNFGQPKTKFLKNTPLKFNIDIDQIQPPVDAGMSNYYGK